MKITYLGHSGFAAEVKDAVLIFDYVEGVLPDFGADKKVLVFASHRHQDHYTKQIFALRELYPDIRFLLSSDIEKECELDLQQIQYMKEDETLEVNGCQIRTLPSTDEGVAFFVTYEGNTLYHAGDLNWWHWADESEDYNAKMKRDYRDAVSRIEGADIDVAFVVLDPRQEQAFSLGLDYFMKHTQTKAVFPMHMWGNYKVIDRLLEEPDADLYREKVYKIQDAGQQFQL